MNRKEAKSLLAVSAIPLLVALLPFILGVEEAVHLKIETDFILIWLTLGGCTLLMRFLEVHCYPKNENRSNRSFWKGFSFLWGPPIAMCIISGYVDMSQHARWAIYTMFCMLWGMMLFARMVNSVQSMQVNDTNPTENKEEN